MKTFFIIVGVILLAAASFIGGNLWQGRQSSPVTNILSVNGGMDTQLSAYAEVQKLKMEYMKRDARLVKKVKAIRASVERELKRLDEVVVTEKGNVITIY